MVDYNDIKQSIATNLPDNKRREITACRLNTSVVTIIKHGIIK